MTWSTTRRRPPSASGRRDGLSRDPPRAPVGCPLRREEAPGRPPADRSSAARDASSTRADQTRHRGRLTTQRPSVARSSAPTRGETQDFPNVVDDAHPAWIAPFDAATSSLNPRVVRGDHRWREAGPRRRGSVRGISARRASHGALLVGVPSTGGSSSRTSSSTSRLTSSRGPRPSTVGRLLVCRPGTGTAGALSLRALAAEAVPSPGLDLQALRGDIFAHCWQYPYSPRSSGSAPPRRTGGACGRARSRRGGTPGRKSSPRSPRSPRSRCPARLGSPLADRVGAHQVLALLQEQIAEVRALLAPRGDRCGLRHAPRRRLGFDRRGRRLGNEPRAPRLLERLAGACRPPSRGLAGAGFFEASLAATGFFFVPDGLTERALEGGFTARFAGFPADGLAFDGFAFIGNPTSCGRDSRSRKRRTIPSCPGSVKDVRCSDSWQIAACSCDSSSS